MQAILFALPAPARLIVGHGVPFHHPPRGFEPLGAVDGVAKILPAENFRPAFFPWRERQALAGFGVVPLPHGVANGAGDPCAFHDLRNQSSITLSRLAIMRSVTASSARSFGKALRWLAIWAS